MKTSPPFGTMIRATRLGWGLSRRHGAFIRMSDADGKNSSIELAPMNAVPKDRLKDRHRCWWDDPSILDMVPWLTCVRKVHRYFRVIVDDAGLIVQG